MIQEKLLYIVQDMLYIRASPLSESLKLLCVHQETFSKCVMKCKYMLFLFLPDDGKVVKAVSVVKDNWDTEEIILEELTVFQVRRSC